MFTLIKLAFRNVFRAKRRTIITFSTISIGLGLLIITMCLMNGIDKQSISNIIHSQTSHLKLFKNGYFEKRDDLPLNNTIKNAPKFYDKLKESPLVKDVESRILFAATLIKGMDELPCLGVACEPDTDPNILNIKDSLLEGSWIDSATSGMVIGRDLANDIGLKVGDIVTVRLITSSKDEDFSWNAMDIEVRGIFDSGNPTVDGNRIIMPLSLAQDALSLEGEVTEIVVCLTGDDDKTLVSGIKWVEEALKSFKTDIKVYSWKDLAGTFLIISKMKTKSSSMIVGIMLIVAAIGIINTMLMSVLERTREIGMFMAMGMKKWEIMKLFIIEGGLIGVFGSLLGCILGGLGSWYLEVKGWSMAAFGETMQEMSEAVYPVKDVYYADLTFDVLLMTFIFGTAIAIIASFYPARKATKLDPIEALRHI